jgi:hypothetical protein
MLAPSGIWWEIAEVLCVSDLDYVNGTLLEILPPEGRDPLGLRLFHLRPAPLLASSSSFRSVSANTFRRTGSGTRQASKSWL